MSSNKTQECIEYINIDKEFHFNLHNHFQELRNEISKKKRKADSEFGNIPGTYINKKIMVKLY